MRRTMTMVATLALAAAAAPILTRKMVDEINMKQNMWVASYDAPTARLDREDAMRIIGALPTPADQRLPLKSFTDKELLAAPSSFDPREQWPNCKTLFEIRDQSHCGSCWAMAAVSSISDRECIMNGNSISFSAEDMLACSGAGNCERGGWPTSAYKYWQKTGVVSEKCRPYSLPGCDHHIANSTNPCPSGPEYPTPKCEKKCTDGYSDWNKDKRYGDKVYSVSGEANLMAELSTNGPCEAAFSVYSDFYAYAGGIYKHTGGSYLGGHAIKIMGYGIENGNKYWLIANSWNPNWGENGYFRILRGKDECGIESEIVCGIAKKL